MVTILAIAGIGFVAHAEQPTTRKRFDLPVIHSSWDDRLDGAETPADWRTRKQILRRGFLDLIRDDQRPNKPPFDVKMHESRQRMYAWMDEHLLSRTR